VSACLANRFRLGFRPRLRGQEAYRSSYLRSLYREGSRRATARGFQSSRSRFPSFGGSSRSSISEWTAWHLSLWLSTKPQRRDMSAGKEAFRKRTKGRGAEGMRQATTRRGSGKGQNACLVTGVPSREENCGMTHCRRELPVTSAKARICTQTGRSPPCRLYAMPAFIGARCPLTPMLQIHPCVSGPQF